MAQSAESPHTTRRRVWRFVFGCLGVVLVIALWPFKGYRIDEGRFVEALGLAYLGKRDYDAREEKSVKFSKLDYDTAREARGWVAATEESVRMTPEMQAIPGLGAFGYRYTDPDPGRVGALVRFGNLVCVLDVYGPRGPQGETHEEIARMGVDAIRDGIGREISGVTTFYNPPARQLWIDRMRPFLRKHFPKLFPPEESPFGPGDESPFS